MASATNGGHVNRALDFYKSEGKYFIIGGSEPWKETTKDGTVVTEIPKEVTGSEFRLEDVIGLKRVDDISLVVHTTEEGEGIIKYRDNNWKRIPELIATTLAYDANTGDTTIIVSDRGIFQEDQHEGYKVRIAGIYEGTITEINSTNEGLSLKLDTAVPANVTIPAGSEVIGGALVEGAKYVYLSCYLEYDKFPISTYRQVGLCTGVKPNKADPDILLPASRSLSGKDEYTSLGVLEVLDNRVPSGRDINQRELLSLVIEF